MFLIYGSWRTELIHETIFQQWKTVLNKLPQTQNKQGQTGTGIHAQQQTTMEENLTGLRGSLSPSSLDPHRQQSLPCRCRVMVSSPQPRLRLTQGARETAPGTPGKEDACGAAGVPYLVSAIPHSPPGSGLKGWEGERWEQVRKSLALHLSLILHICSKHLKCWCVASPAAGKQSSCISQWPVAQGNTLEICPLDFGCFSSLPAKPGRTADPALCH